MEPSSPIKTNLAQAVKGLKTGRFDQVVVLVNRYDGIDLSDDVAGFSVSDGKPYSESLVDLYQEACRTGSQSTLMRTVRTIEQGLGAQCARREGFSNSDYGCGSYPFVEGQDIASLLFQSNGYPD